jgi:hypothetical protein
LKKNRRIVSILLTLAMLAAMLLPLAGPALGATTYSAAKVLSVSPGSTNTDGNKVTITGAADSLEVGDTVYLSLPTDFTMRGTVTIPASVDGKPNDVTAISGNTTFTDENRIQITVDTVESGVYVPYIYVNIDSLTIPGGASGDVKLTAEAAPNSGFSNGEVLIARVGSGQVTLGLDKAVLITSAGGTIDTIRVKETLAGDLEVSNTSLKFKLPNGFTWNIAGAAITQVWGAGLVLGAPTLSDSDRTLNIDVDAASTSATYLRIAGLRINVDESVAKFGDVEVTVSGKSSVVPTSAVIAKYGDYEVKVSSVETKTIIAGKREKEIGKFAIEETVPGSLIDGRTITLTLPDKAKWDGEYPSISASDSTLLGFATSGWTAVGTDKRIIKTTVTTASSGDKPTKIVFKGGEITVAADYTGDIALEVGGSAGASGSAVVAKVLAPITATADGKPDIIIGLPNQAGADFTITEAKAEALKADKWLYIEAPPGLRFATAPKFEVTEGDLRLGTVEADNDWGYISVKVKSTSSKPSTIKVSGVKLTADRTVPEGDVILKIGGSSLVENNSSDLFPDVNWAAKVAAATCVTPAPGETKITSVFKIGDTSYTVGGDVYETKTMDVAPYIKDGRTYLPVRYVAYCLGLTDANIIWDDANDTVTLIKSGTVVQLKIGSNTLLVNGASITMDVAPEIVDPGRTMLPIRWVAEAFGAVVTWDEAAQTVKIEI